VLNAAGLAIFATLFWLTARRGATDPVCGMKVDRAKTVAKGFGAQTYYICSQHCLHAFEADPARYLDGSGRPTEQAAAEHHGGHAHGRPRRQGPEHGPSPS
jgi:YHS domain-containing protein